MRFSFNLKTLVLGVIVICMSGCAAMFNQPLLSSESAKLGVDTQTFSELKRLPAPKERVVVAVYKFRDQTGQYKVTETGASWSTAITQGATSILLRALEASEWFTPIEREGLANLLNERKIIRSSRSHFMGTDGDNENVLPPLMYAGIIIEGGIISYDSNILTGGAGLRYFGTGGSGQYRQDRVTIYLRAVSTSNGKILKTVYTSKTILSQKVDASMFKFVKFKRLMEAETGFTYNEPSELAVKEAIEMGVQSLIVEGLYDGLWELENAEDINSEVIQAYVKEKDANEKTDFFGMTSIYNPGKFHIGVAGQGIVYDGDYSMTEVAPGLHFEMGGRVSPRLDLAGAMSFGTLSTRTDYEQSFNSLELLGRYRFFPNNKFTPFLHLGGGVVTRTTDIFSFSLSEELYPKLVTGAGFEYLFNDNLGLNIEFTHHYLFTDELDGIEQGSYNDWYWQGNLGLTYYFDF